MDATAHPPPVMTRDMALVPLCTVVPSFAITRVLPPPVSVVTGFFNAVVSKSSKTPKGMLGVSVNVGVIVDVMVMVYVGEFVGLIKSVFVGVIVGE